MLGHAKLADTTVYLHLSQWHLQAVASPLEALEVAGRASDEAIRSLVISYKLLGTKEFFVIHHTDCGMLFFTNELIRGLLSKSLETAELGADGFHDVGKGPGSRAGEFIEWLTIADAKQAFVDDVARIRNHPLVPSSIPIYGDIYNVRSGQLVEVPDATKVGRAG